ncbi:MAG TPA: phage regulatory CII family protein [Stenotrophomonas sp.]|nr:phage regulatory CII family protein [Stenotrophomonas sp.]
MNIIDTAHKTVHAYPGGSESLAPRLGMSAAVLRNKVNPNNTTHHLTLAEASEIMGVTGDDGILHALAAEHGYVLQRIDAAGPGGVFPSMLENASKQGAFAQALQDALSDGLISENEMRAIAAAGTAQMGALINLLARLREVTGRPGVMA